MFRAPECNRIRGSFLPKYKLMHHHKILTMAQKAELMCGITISHAISYDPFELGSESKCSYGNINPAYDFKMRKLKGTLLEARVRFSMNYAM